MSSVESQEDNSTLEGSGIPVTSNLAASISGKVNQYKHYKGKLLNCSHFLCMALPSVCNGVGSDRPHLHSSTSWKQCSTVSPSCQLSSYLDCKRAGSIVSNASQETGQEASTPSSPEVELNDSTKQDNARPTSSHAVASSLADLPAGVIDSGLASSKTCC